MSWLGDVLGFEKFHGANILKDIVHKPTRLLTGVDPASTSVWNTVLGTHDKPIVDQMGGATPDRYRQAESSGINVGPGKGMQNVAHVIAGLMAANYGANSLGSLPGSAPESNSALASSGQSNPMDWSNIARSFLSNGGGGNQYRPKSAQQDGTQVQLLIDELRKLKSQESPQWFTPKE